MLDLQCEPHASSTNCNRVVHKINGWLSQSSHINFSDLANSQLTAKFDVFPQTFCAACMYMAAVAQEITNTC